VCLAILDQREKWVPEETKVSVVLLGKMECVGHQACKARRAGQGTPALLGNKEKREIWEMLARWDHQGFKVLPAWLDNLGSKECQECLEILDHQGDKEMPVPPVLMGRMELMVKQEILAHPGTEGSPEKMEVQEFKD
jgi:hypothetical protein